MQKTSLKTKKLKGTLQKCRVKNTPAYEKLATIPAPAFLLNKYGASYFNQFCQMLIDNQLMTAAYIPIITRAAKYFEFYKEAEERIINVGLVQIAEKTGWEQKSAWFTIMTDVEDRITKIEEKFGMTLMTMSKIDIPEKKTEDPLEELTK